LSDENAATATAADESTTETETEAPATEAGDGDLMKALRNERELHKTEHKRAVAAEAERDSLREKLTATESKLADAEKTGAQALRIAVAVETGLDPALAPRLQGTTHEELASDAREILGAITGTGGGEGLDGGARRTAPTGKGTPAQQHGRFIGALMNGATEEEATEAAAGEGLWS
jgi:hypothetical protein